MMLTTPDLSDQNDDAKVIELSFQHYGNIKSFYGQIETAVCPDDNSYVKEILEEEGNNRLLFIDGAGSIKCALLGDMLASKAINNNWSGRVLNGQNERCSGLLRQGQDCGCLTSTEMMMFYDIKD